MEYVLTNKYHLSKIVQQVIFTDTEKDEWVTLSVLDKEKGVVHMASLKKSELKRMGRSL